MLRVAFLGALSSSFAERVRGHLTVPCEFIHTDERNVPAVLPEVDVLIALAFTGEMAAGARRLRLIQVPGAGLDRIDRAAVPTTAWLASAHGHEVGIAEYAIGAMIALGREFGRVDGRLRAGRWDSQWAPGIPTPPPWPELAGRTLGVLGYGGIGRELARRARAFDMRVCAIRRHPGRSADDDLALLGGLDLLDEVLQRSDYLAVALPLTAETRGLMGERELRLMKPTAILVSVGRAQVLDEDALYDALAAGRIRGAALDVWYRYPSTADPAPPAHRPFHELPNVLMTPHVAGWTDGTLEARATAMAENIERTARGEPPRNLVPGTGRSA
jgi:phosphoglycerate dehydrogenase-like enzyme